MSGDAVLLNKLNADYYGIYMSDELDDLMFAKRVNYTLKPKEGGGGISEFEIDSSQLSKNTSNSQ